MKKNTIKAFTLVEMLIVIVIIGILIASLMPRMQSAQGRARDVARKNDLAQIQTAIITSQQDKGEWPQLDGGAKTGMNVHGIETELLRAGMSSVPADPNKSNNVSGLGKNGAAYSGGEYAYMVAKRNGVDNGGFVLMAKTEVEGGSNWVFCGSGSSNLTGGYIGEAGLDLKNITTCTKFTYNDGGSDCTTEKDSTKGNCVYNDVNQLRYILLY